jgi:hypothetical protein
MVINYSSGHTPRRQRRRPNTHRGHQTVHHVTWTPSATDDTERRAAAKRVVAVLIGRTTNRTDA